MKKQLFSLYVPVIIGMLSLSAFTGSVCAQSPVPNGNFESWISSSIETPTFYPNTSNKQLFFKNQGGANAVKVTPSYHGNYALQLTTIVAGTDTAFGYIVNGNPDNDPNTWVGGIAYNQMPTGMRGYYKCNMMSGDSGLVIVAFSKAGSNIGSYVIPIGGVHATYTLFNTTFSPALSQTPDSVMLAFTSSNVFSSSGMPGSTLTIDSVSFTGVSSQPSLMNGDFELWQNQLVNMPSNWYFNGNDNGDGMSQTADAHSGSYAMELTTYYANDKYGPQANAGRVGTGWYPNNCSSNCTEQGGYPFSRQVDTLTFYYKYAPSGSDTAVVQLNFKKNGSQIWGNSIFLFTASTYQYVEFPINIGMAPDTVIIDLQSSTWNDTAVSFVGSDLKIDDIYFKSQLQTGIPEAKNNTGKTELYPNPFHSSATLEINSQVSLNGLEVCIYDVFGRTLKTVDVLAHKMTFEKGDLSAGVYFYEVRNSSEILKTGKMIVE